MPKQNKVVLKIETKVLYISLFAKAFKAGLSRTKGWFQKVFVGLVAQRDRGGALALVERTAKRVGFGDWYTEKVTMQDTGEVIHQQEEPLSQHQNHGSTKKPKTHPPNSN